jgi:hypothetical protein
MYAFEPKYAHQAKPKAIFDIKKQGILDFCCLSPSLLSYIGPNSANMIDTLIHPKRQMIYKAPMNGNSNNSSSSMAIQHLNQKKLLIMKKDILYVYDLRMDYP